MLIILNFILTNMHPEILTETQTNLLPLVKQFSRNFYLVGGTAIAFHLGHRRSIDFDLFTDKKFENLAIRKKIRKSRHFIDKILKDELDQFTLIIGGVSLTFFRYPFEIEHKVKFESWIFLPNLLTLAAMKAYALGRRPKWKDYVDLYFILKQYEIGEIEKRAKEVFGSEFNGKLFRGQLAYFEDINYSEKVEFLTGFEVSDDKVKKVLIEASLTR